MITKDLIVQDSVSLQHPVKTYKDLSLSSVTTFNKAAICCEHLIVLLYPSMITRDLIVQDSVSLQHPVNTTKDLSLSSVTTFN
jgi:hypothetical protein